MKIDFNASYREISRLINTRKEQPTAPADRGFHNLLADIAPIPTAVEANNSNQLDPNIGLSNGSDSSAMARMRFPTPEIEAPQFERIKPPIIEGQSADLSVKTPTLVEAHRSPSQPKTSKQEERENVADIKKLVSMAGEKHGIDPALGVAVAAAESSFNPAAVSSDGHASKGLFQLLDSTGKHLLEKSGLEQRYDPFDPDQNIELGVGYLRYLHDLFSKDGELMNSLKVRAAANSSSLEKLAVAAFNAGEGRVASAQMRALKAGKDPSEYQHVQAYLPETTQDYVSRVFTSREQFEDENEG